MVFDSNADKGRRADEVANGAKSEAGYTANRFLTMITEQGGYEAARTLLHAQSVSEGYTALWERNRLDLTIEAVILKSEWLDLFSQEERNIARDRLTQYGYDLNQIS